MKKVFDNFSETKQGLYNFNVVLAVNFLLKYKHIITTELSKAAQLY